MADSETSSVAPTSTTPIYSSHSSVWRTANKIYGILTALVVAVSIIMCAVKGVSYKVDYLLLTNIVFTSFICIVNVYWYKKSDLAEDKVWFLLFIYTIILLQCITSDIYIFVNPSSSSNNVKSTHLPLTTHIHKNITWLPIRPAQTTKLIPEV